MNCNNTALQDVNRDIVACTRCPRLLKHCAEVAIAKRRAYLNWDYWGKPVPSFGDPEARLLIVGLAPGAHGANRTGRMFTGDRSGEFLYRAMFRAGFASQPDGVSISDGLRLRGAWITASAHCAPPDNKPLPEEIRNCRSYLKREIELLPEVRVVMLLGKLAFEAYRSAMRELGKVDLAAKFKFGHNVLVSGSPAALCSYHPSQQNTSTGRLTEAMLDEVFSHARELIEAAPSRFVLDP